MGEITGGSAHSTSVHETWKPLDAFREDSSRGFHSRKPERYPVLVWYEFPEEKLFVPGRVSFRGRQDAGLAPPLQTPSEWQFIGSNDQTCGKFGKWTILCEDRTNVGPATMSSTKYCDVDEKIFKKFKCLGISILNNRDKTGHASFRDVRMWEKVYE